MDPRLQKAISNNNGLYEAVFNCFRIPFESADDVWYSQERVPPLYSNLVTRSAAWRPGMDFEKIEVAAETQEWDSWSVKDSFDCLDLSSYGFEKLFDAYWIYLCADRFTPRPYENGPNYKMVESAEALEKWCRAWDPETELGNKIFNRKLIENPNIWLLAGENDDGIVSGCLVNKAEDVLGISNFFAPAYGENHGTGMIRAILDLIGTADIVGYERETSVLNEVTRLGFDSVGDLSVWEKTLA